MLELQSRLLDDFTELNEQVEKQVERLAELKEKRDANPGTSDHVCTCDVYVISN